MGNSHRPGRSSTTRGVKTSIARATTSNVRASFASSASTHTASGQRASASRRRIPRVTPDRARLGRRAAHDVATPDAFAHDERTIPQIVPHRCCRRDGGPRSPASPDTTHTPYGSSGVTSSRLCALIRPAACARTPFPSTRTSTAQPGASRPPPVASPDQFRPCAWRRRVASTGHGPSATSTVARSRARAVSRRASPGRRLGGNLRPRRAKPRRAGRRRPSPNVRARPGGRSRTVPARRRPRPPPAPPWSRRGRRPLPTRPRRWSPRRAGAQRSSTPHPVAHRAQPCCRVEYRPPGEGDRSDRRRRGAGHRPAPPERPGWPPPATAPGRARPAGEERRSGKERGIRGCDHDPTIANICSPPQESPNRGPPEFPPLAPAIATVLARVLSPVLARQLRALLRKWSSRSVGP